MLNHYNNTLCTVKHLYFINYVRRISYQNLSQETKAGTAGIIRKIKLITNNECT